jgi:TPR repeat protein
MYGQYELATILMKTDASSAMVLFRLAAEQNYEEAQCMLGYLSAKDVNPDQDVVEALRWFKLAAAQGLPFAL